jgi:hypothetical protein
MGILQRFEDRLEQLVSGAFARAFRSAVQPVEVAAALQREVDNSAQILSRNRRLVPNQFHVELSPQDHERLAPYSSTLVEELTEMLREHAQEQSYVFTGPVSISFDEHDDLSTGRFRVRSAALAKVTPIGGTPATDTAVRRARVILEVNGMRHPLDPPGIVIGRGSEADLRINDPGVPAARRDPGLLRGRRRAAGERGGPGLDQRHAGQRRTRPGGVARRRRHREDRQHHAAGPLRAPVRGHGRCLS